MNSHLRPNDFYKVFDLMSDTPDADIDKLQRILITPKRGKPNRTTVSRLKSVVSEVMKRGNEPLTEEDVEMIAKTAGYETSLNYVQKVHLYYTNWVTQKKLKESVDKRLEQHQKDLSSAAKKLSAKLRLVRRHTLMAEATIAEYGVEEKDFELLELLEDDYVRCLLPHIQEELKKLRRLTSWDDLRIRDITEELLDILFLRASRREFEGKCIICYEWV